MSEKERDNRCPHCGQPMPAIVIKYKGSATVTYMTTAGSPNRIPRLRDSQ